MKLSTRVRFGLRIMVQVAVGEDSGPVMARLIAAQQGISEPYVDQILMPLRAAGLLRSLRGRNGGYLLGHQAETITVLDVLEALEGKLALVECLDNDKICDRLAACVTHGVWKECSDVLIKILSATTLAELRERHNQLQDAIDYVI